MKFQILRIMKTWKWLTQLTVCFNKIMKCQTLWIRGISIKPWNISINELWLFRWIHAMSMLMNYHYFNETMHEITKFRPISTIFLWNHEVSNLMNCLFYETMKGQTLWSWIKVVSMKCQILRIMNYQMSTRWRKSVSRKPWNARH